MNSMASSVMALRMSPVYSLYKYLHKLALVLTIPYSFNSHFLDSRSDFDKFDNFDKPYFTNHAYPLLIMTSVINPSALKGLEAALKTAHVYVPGRQGYDAAIQRWSDVGVKHAVSPRLLICLISHHLKGICKRDNLLTESQGVVVQPIHVEDIQTALLWGQANELDIAIKGGGHSAAGTSSSDGGLVIDLKRMDEVIVDPINRTVTAQGGALWEHVDRTAAKADLAAVGGTVNHTGVGGLTLGGGYGWLSGEHGLAIDNLLSVTLVLADGRVVTASSNENEDLFWALRGAGHNFGVAVDFTFRAHKQSELVFSGIVAYLPEYLELAINSLNTTASDPKAAAMCIIRKPCSSPVPLVYVIPFYNGPLQAGMEHFRGLFEIETVDRSVGMIPYEQVNSLQNPMSTYGYRQSFKGVFYDPPLDLKFARDMYQEFATTLKNDPDLSGSAILLEYFDTRKICEVPQTATAFASRNTIRNGVLFMRWTDPHKDFQHRAWGDRLQNLWKARLDAKNKSNPENGDASAQVPQYINYAERKLLPMLPSFSRLAKHMLTSLLQPAMLRLQTSMVSIRRSSRD